MGEKSYQSTEGGTISLQYLMGDLTIAVGYLCLKRESLRTSSPKMKGFFFFK